MKKISGILGILLVFFGFYWLWGASPDAELNDIIERVKIGISMILFGNLMVIFYMYNR